MNSAPIEENFIAGNEKRFGVFKEIKNNELKDWNEK